MSLKRVSLWSKMMTHTKCLISMTVQKLEIDSTDQTELRPIDCPQAMMFQLTASSTQMTRIIGEEDPTVLDLKKANPSLRAASKKIIMVEGDLGLGGTLLTTRLMKQVPLIKVQVKMSERNAMNLLRKSKLLQEITRKRG